MNNRIKELAKQAGRTGLPYGEVEIQKFAELIVKECANIDFRHAIGLTSDQSYEVSELIEKHFGVE